MFDKTMDLEALVAEQSRHPVWGAFATGLVSLGLVSLYYPCTTEEGESC